MHSQPSRLEERTAKNGRRRHPPAAYARIGTLAGVPIAKGALGFIAPQRVVRGRRVRADEITALIEAIAGLIAAVAWPALVLFILVRFRRPLGEFIANLGEFSVKAPGVEATARRRVEAAALLGAAAGARGPVRSGEQTDPRDIAGSLVEAIPGARTQARIQGARVLWVDDRPSNNRFERQALEALGVRVETSTSTDDALEGIRRRVYDLVISDMSRPPDKNAGLTLLDRLREIGKDQPFIIYAGSAPVDRVREARQRGAYGYTASPQELVMLVTTALANR
jgi:CheY-like chemotaxis protein